MLIGGVNNLPSNGIIMATLLSHRKAVIKNDPKDTLVTVVIDDVTIWQVWTSLDQFWTEYVGLYTCTIEYYQCSCAKHGFWNWFHTLSLKRPIKIGLNWSFKNGHLWPHLMLHFRSPCQSNVIRNFLKSSFFRLDRISNLNFIWTWITRLRFAPEKIGKLYLVIPSLDMISPYVSELLVD